jgi:nascent polypeptide-associated complex subunit alpha
METMFGGLDKRQMEKMMKQMGIASEEVEASEVIIKAKGKDILISNPQVTKIKMGGTASFQISGSVTERTAAEFSQEDINIIMDQANVSEAEAREALKKEGDMAAAILKLRKQQ